MNAPTGTDPFAEWGAAYVLGALSADDRAAFEAHLRECRNCRRAIAELAGVPGLLSVVPADEALALLEEEPSTGDAPRTPADGPPASGRIGSAAGSSAAAGSSTVSDTNGAARAGRAPDPRAGRDLSALITRAQRSRRRRRLGAGVAAAAGIAAVLIVLLAVVVPGLRPDSRELDVTLAPVTETSLTATAQLRSTTDGTQLSATCNYGRPGSGDAEYPDRADRGTFGLFVTTSDGEVEQVATWSAGPGETVEAAGHTGFDFDQIQSVQIGPADQSRVLLRADLTP